MTTITLPPSNVKLFKIAKARVEKSGRQINRAVCTDCPWSYEIESTNGCALQSAAHIAKAHAEAHRYDFRHVVELRCNILDLFIERLVPRSES